MQNVKLASVCKFKQWHTIPTKKLQEEGYPVWGANGIIGYTDTYNHEQPTIMICCRGATCGSINVSEGKCYINGNAMCLDNLSDDFLLDYVKYYLKHYDFSSIITGAAQPQITQIGLQKILIPCRSLSEQKEIVYTLARLEHLKDYKAIVLKSLDELVKSRFIEMFGNYEKKISIKEVCNVTGGYAFKSKDLCSEGIKLLQISNVALNDITWDNVNYLPNNFLEKYSNWLLKKDDIVVALTRPIIQSLGNVKSCLVKDCDTPCLLNQRVGKISPRDKNKTSFIYIFSCLMTDDFTNHVKSCSTGCSQPNISTKDIENYFIPNASIEQQNEFEAFYKQVDKSKFVVSLA